MVDEHMVALNASRYTDWHISLREPHHAVVFPGPKPIDENLIDFAQGLGLATHAAHAAAAGGSFNVEYMGLRFRGQHRQDDRYALRAMKSMLWPIEKLGLLPDHANFLLGENLGITGGLVLVAGPTGSGKTTTVGTVIGGRLASLGGFCQTLEDPPEEPLQGWHRNAAGDEVGFCDQIHVHDGNFEIAVAEALRCFPARQRSMLLISEVRTKSASAEMLRIAVGGHLVFTTIHANGIVEALERLLSLASHEVGEYMARSFLAESLRGCMFQTINQAGRLQASLLKADQTVASIIRKGDLVSLQDSLIQQEKNIRPRPVAASVGAARPRM